MENCSILDMEFDWECDGEEKGEITGNSEAGALEEEDARPGTPDELVNAADEASKDLLPSKSKDRYQQVYNNFQKWKAVKNAMGVKSAPSTLWAQYSMLKSTMKIYDSVDISKYASLIAYLKKKYKGHVPKKAKILTEQELRTFIETAPDVAWLDVKIACIFAIFGACRSHELPNIRMDDIIRYDDMFYVTVKDDDTKTGYGNGFAITPPLLDKVKSYENLRPPNAKSDRFFLNFQQGKCFNQVIGVNKFYKMPQRIAAFLNLPDYLQIQTQPLLI
ncbi:hypothetical protein HA402_009368 [Bradysia odoriphaga]|nr:hypothetical protein HA402_009368 [Bradysia odoriphaga]